MIIEQTLSEPQAPLVHRSAVAVADGTSKPAATSALFLANPGGYMTARVFVSTTGSPTTCTLRPYLRCGGTVGQVNASALQTFNGSPNFDAGFDIAVDGDDLCIYVETLAGGVAPTVSIYVSWR